MSKNASEHLDPLAQRVDDSSSFVIQRTDGSIAFQGKAKSKEKLLARCIRKYRGKQVANAPNKNPFGNLMLDDFNFHFLDLSGIDLTGSTFRGSKILAGEVNGCNFTDCDFTDARISLFGVNTVFKRAKLENSDISNSVLRSPDFTDAIISSTKAQNMELTRPKFDYALVRSSDMSSAKIVDPSLFDSKFTQVNFSNASFLSTELSGVHGPQRLMVPELSPLTKGSIFLCCTYAGSKIDKRFSAIRRDRISGYVADIAMTFASAVFTGLAIEHTMEYLKPWLDNEHSKTIFGGVALIAGTTFLREIATDKLKENVRSVMTKVWRAGRDMTMRCVQTGMDIWDVVSVVGSKKGMGPLKMAIQAEISKNGSKSKMALLTDIVKSGVKGESIQIITCESKYVARALEALTRFYHKKNNRHDDINIVLCNSQNTHNHSNVPCSLTLGRDGDMTAVWFKQDDISNKLVREAVVKYNSDGLVIEAAGEKDAMLSPKEVEALGASDGKALLKSFIKEVIQEPSLKERGVVFDLETNYVDVANNGDFSIRKVSKNIIDNKYGPAIYSGSQPASRIFFREGKMMTYSEGWNMLQNRQRSDGLVAADDSLLPQIPGPATAAPDQGDDKEVDDVAPTLTLDDDDGPDEDAPAPAPSPKSPEM